MDSVNAVKLPSANLKKASFKKFSPNKFHFPLLLIVFMLFFIGGWSIGGWQKGALEEGKMPEVFVTDSVFCPIPTDNIDSIDSWFDGQGNLKAYVYKGARVWHYICNMPGGGQPASGPGGPGTVCTASYTKTLTDLWDSEGIREQGRYGSHSIPTTGIDSIDSWPDGAGNLKAYVYKGNRVWHYICNLPGGEGTICTAQYTKTLTDLWSVITYQSHYWDVWKPTSDIDSIDSWHYQFPNGSGNVKVYIYKGPNIWYYVCVTGHSTATGCRAKSVYTNIDPVTSTHSLAELWSKAIEGQANWQCPCSSGQTGTRGCTITNGTGSQTRSCTSSGNWGSWGSCTVVSCNSGYHKSGSSCVANQCTGSQRRCLDGKPQLCQNYLWVNQTACATYQTCQPASGTCVNNSTYCETNGAKTCSNSIPQLCVNNEWEAQTACIAGKECSSGACVDISGYCASNDDCADNQECNTDINSCEDITCITINDCKEVTTQNHTCVETNKPNGTSCPDGICSSGACVSPGADFLISLDIDLEVKDDDSSDEVVVKLKKDGEDRVDPQTVAVDSSGRNPSIGFNELEEGEYRLIVKPKGYLSRAINITLTGGETIEASFPEVFLAGDLNETSYNLINSMDFSIFKNYFKAGDRAADFNDDGLVNTLDYSIFVRNFNKTGEE